MDNILNFFTEGFEKFLEKNYDGQVKKEAYIQPVVEIKPAVKPKPAPKKKPFPPVTWYVLRYETLDNGDVRAVVVIKHGRTKEKYEAAEWLKLVDFEPGLSCFIHSVISAVNTASVVQPLDPPKEQLTPCYAI